MQVSNEALIEELRARFGAQGIAPEDAAYDEARKVFYGDVDRRPAGVVRARDGSVVADVIRFAREANVDLAVRSGGHSLAGHCVIDGGVVLDLSALNIIEIDTENRTAWTGSGARTGAYTRAVGEHGLATGFGDAATVGIGGITLGGGVGFLVRKHGLTIDSLLAADVVTADGEWIRADADTHSDLFWAIRGGGGNFGVVTRFQFRLHALNGIVGGMLMLPATANVIQSLIDVAEEAPEELSVIANVMSAPPFPFVPPEYHGRLVVMTLLAYAGDTEAGERAIRPLRELATPIVDTVRAMPYGDIFPPEDPSYRPKAVGRTMFADRVGRDTADAILEYLSRSDAPMRVAQLRPLGGAVSRVAADATAYAHRARRFMVNVAALYQEAGDRQRHDEWAAEFAAVLPGVVRGAYVNFLGVADESRVHDAYPGDTWNRLSRIKRRYDPDNLFRGNHNIPPAEVRQEEATLTS